MKNLMAAIVMVLCATNAMAQKADSLSATSLRLTPFNPQGNYHTFGIKTRLLPWVLGNNNGLNYLLGAELGFFKRHSASIDFTANYSNQNVEAYYRHDSLILPKRSRSRAYTEWHVSYNYYFNAHNLRQKGCLFYAGINFRKGHSRLQSDTSVFINDYTILSERNYRSLGPHLGFLYVFGNTKHLALNVVATAFYNQKSVSVTESKNVKLQHYDYNFNTVDFKLGLSLYWWFRYGQR
ncbi:MAG: hypothetical protein IT236_13275 [Bacteroidia bacterium]|nr:hypothetical protein [Bacteroidia bacterium]